VGRITGREPQATARKVGMFQPIIGTRARVCVGVHTSGGIEARVLGDGMMSLHEHTLSGFKARSAESLTAVGREIRMGLCEWDAPLSVPSRSAKLVSTMLSRACMLRRIVPLYKDNAAMGPRELKRRHV